MRTDTRLDLETVTLADLIDWRAGPEVIIGAVVGDHVWDERPGGPKTVRPWAEARALLDYEPSHAFGPEDCHAVYAWTASRLIVVTQYDGLTGVTALPTVPTDVDPRRL